MKVFEKILRNKKGLTGAGVETSAYMVALVVASISAISIVFSGFWLKYVGEPIGPGLQLFLILMVNVAIWLVVVKKEQLKFSDLWIPSILSIVLTFGIQFYISPERLPQLFDSQAIITAKNWAIQQNILPFA